jgi:toxin ParE1/3/4
MAAKNRQLQLTPLAEFDLEEIWLYTVQHWSVDQTDRYVRDLLDTMQALARGRKSGQVCTVREGYFRYSAGSHIVFYRQTPGTLNVVRVLHQRMDIERHLQ